MPSSWSMACCISVTPCMKHHRTSCTYLGATSASQRDIGQARVDRRIKQILHRLPSAAARSGRLS
jgi:hypothetical protein